MPCVHIPKALDPEGLDRTLDPEGLESGTDDLLLLVPARVTCQMRKLVWNEYGTGMEQTSSAISVLR